MDILKMVEVHHKYKKLIYQTKKEQLEQDFK